MDPSYTIIDGFITQTPSLTTSTSGNETLQYDPYICTLQTCDPSLAAFTYIPNLADNALFLAIFVVLFVAQAILGLWHRTWGFMGVMLLGLVRDKFFPPNLQYISIHKSQLMHGRFANISKNPVDPRNPRLRRPPLPPLQPFLQTRLSRIPLLRNPRPRLLNRSHLPLSRTHHHRLLGSILPLHTSNLHAHLQRM